MKIAKLLYGAAIALILSACSSHKTMLPYFTDLPEEGSLALGEYGIKIVADDELLINVSATDDDAVQDYLIPYQKPRIKDYNTPLTQTLESALTTRKNAALTYQTYKVNAEGFINFPVLGKIHVAGMTPSALAEYLEEKIGEKVINPIVTVELVNFHINVMGEVTRPGTQLVNRERVTILDALATAGDLTPWGERNNVLLIREEDGKRVYHRLNLNDSKILESPYFYLQQNDVIYVEPNSVREANSRMNSEKQYRLSMTSVIVSAASVIATLVIALFIR
ncbi:MAG: polysaccharide biosynthesis/export family protein [Bacteroides sp.]|nr:polysaccharide biosynthesis/export family protein [Bacteroides sp.]MCM1380233.1 polysaccharide biosynthesis/export family protein [Bacteroides sp.]MCM1446541.1 polysaccharide biosynthesis/export family protein [Prevotella sp.]